MDGYITEADGNQKMFWSVSNCRRCYCLVLTVSSLPELRYQPIIVNGFSDCAVTIAKYQTLASKTHLFCEKYLPTFMQLSSLLKYCCYTVQYLQRFKKIKIIKNIILTVHLTLHSVLKIWPQQYCFCNWIIADL